MIYAPLIVIVATALFYSSAVCAQDAERTKCWTNEAKYPCGKRCEDRCSAPAPSYCGHGLQCEGFACRCKNGYARDPRENSCVRKEDCPVNKCAYGEFEGACGTTCEGTCESPKTPEICARIRCSNVSCRCDLDGGFVRNREGNCVRIEDC